MPGGRPAKPMYPNAESSARPAPTPDPNSPEELLADGAMSYDGAAAFCGISKRSIERCVELGELEVLYYGRKPLIPKRQLVMWLAKKLEAARAERAEWERTWGWPRRPG